MRSILMLGALAIALTGCAALIPSSVNIASSPQADAMRLCGAMVDVTTPGVSIPAIASLARNALNPAVVNKLGDDPAEAMRTCASMYDELTE